MKRLQLYRTDAIEVTFDPNRCIHAAACIRTLPAVFDSRARPWIRPAAAAPDAVAAAVVRCPTGALRYRRFDGGAAEAPDATGGSGTVMVTVTAKRDGPLYVRGDVQLALEDGTVVLRDLRVALCRCGQSANQPYCDGTHKAIGFVDGSRRAAPAVESRPPDDAAAASPPPPGAAVADALLVDGPREGDAAVEGETSSDRTAGS